MTHDLPIDHDEISSLYSLFTQFPQLHQLILDLKLPHPFLLLYRRSFNDQYRIRNHHQFLKELVSISTL